MTIITPIELSKLSVSEQNTVLQRLAGEGFRVARNDDKVQGCGGVGRITGGLNKSVLLGGKPIATVGSSIVIEADSHGCPSCPHFCTGKIITGIPHVRLNGQPLAVVGSKTIHAVCCGANMGVVKEGYAGLLPSAMRMTQAQMALIAIKLTRL